jgi:redox-sensitive bicupin YhaK (pirin superfamily)
MITLRPSRERGHARHGWLESRHTFSFAGYHDRNHMGYRTLRVINEDQVAPGQGFGTHPHRDMEIVSYVNDGALEHRDSMGNGSIVRPGDVQRMSAGDGLTHSEFNHSATDGLHFLQIWILPSRTGGPPSYEQKHFPVAARQGTLRLVASGDGRDDSISLQQDADIYASLLEPGEKVRLPLREGRGAWLQVVRGNLEVLGKPLEAGDGAAIDDVDAIDIEAITRSEFLLMDLAQA